MHASARADTRYNIINAALRLLEEDGIAIDDAESREILSGAGATVGNDGRVRLPCSFVGTAIALAPQQFGIYDREGVLAMMLGGNRVHFTPGSAAIRILDSATGEQRTPVTADLVAFAELTDALPHYAAQSTALVPGDVPPEVADSSRLAVALLHAKKPVVTWTFRKESFAVMRDMLAIVAVRAGINNIAGPGMLACLNCQSLEKLRADHEACAVAMRLAEGMVLREHPAFIIDVIREGIAQGEFLSLPHTRKWHRAEAPRTPAAIHPSISPLSASRAAEVRSRMEEEFQRYGAAFPLPVREG